MDEVYEKINQARQEHIDYLVDEIMPIIFNRVFQEGYNLSSDECNNSTILFVEAFKSAMNQSVNIYHPLQDISDNMQFSEDVDTIAVTDNDELQLTKDYEVDTTGLQSMRHIKLDDAVKDK